MHNIRYLRVVLTERCNLNCFFCHKEGCFENKDRYELSVEQMYEYITMLVKNGIRKIKLMGGEPTLYIGLSDLIKRLRNYDHSLDISMITNGIATPAIYDDVIRAGINRINVSVHGFDETVFNKVTKGTNTQLSKMKDSIAYLKEKNVLGKLNYVLLKGVNEDEFFQVLEYVYRNDLVLDVLNYLGDDQESINKLYYSFEEIEKMICDKYQVLHESKYVNPYSIDSKRIALRGGGIVNLKVNQLKDFEFLKACDKCDKKDICKEGISAVRLTHTGIIKPCLFRHDLYFDLPVNVQKYGSEEVTNMINEYFNNL